MFFFKSLWIIFFEWIYSISVIIFDKLKGFENHHNNPKIITKLGKAVEKNKNNKRLYNALSNLTCKEQRNLLSFVLSIWLNDSKIFFIWSCFFHNSSWLKFWLWEFFEGIISNWIISSSFSNKARHKVIMK